MCRLSLASRILLVAVIAVFPTGAATALDFDVDPPTLSQVQTAITDSSANWTAGTGTIANLSWDNFYNRLGWIIPSNPPSATQTEPFHYVSALADLPDSLDWRNKNGVNYVSSVKNQGSCGSCWAFAGVGVVESLRKITGLAPCGFENLSEQFLVSCWNQDGCSGGNAASTGNFLRDTGVPDEACFTYQAKDSTDNVPCSNRCSDWSSRVRKIKSWTAIRDSWYPTNPGAVDSIKQALQNGPLWTGMRVPTDFKFYQRGVYRHVLGNPLNRGHAIIIVGYNDSGNYFICKNSWGSNWGENGYFRIAYSEVYRPQVMFGAWTTEYDMSGLTPACFRYSGDIAAAYDWIYANEPVRPLGDEDLELIDTPFPLKVYCTTYNEATISSNGWLSMGADASDPWYVNYPIPHDAGPPAMIAPLWTDLNPDSPFADGIYTQDTGDGRFVIEYREIPRFGNGELESFEVILFDPAVYPTPTGDAKIKFQYQLHDPAMEQHTVGIENDEETCGQEIWYQPQFAPEARGRSGTPIHEEMAIEFTPIPNGDEYPPEPPTGLATGYGEPFVTAEWYNPTHNTGGFELPFIEAVVVGIDGTPVAELEGEPGQHMSYSARGVASGSHDVSVSVYAGTQQSDAVSAPVDVPPRVSHLAHDVGNVDFTITDQGICGFTAADHGDGVGFRYGGPSEDNCLYVGSLWLSTDPLHALNRDYADDPYTDWMWWSDCENLGAGISDQDYAASYDDGGHFDPGRFHVDQKSYAWAGDPADDFVIIVYTITNTSDDDAGGVYAGQFMDWDLQVSGAQANEGAVDPALNLVYMWGDGDPYVGAALLGGWPAEDHPAANLTLIHNPTFVWPDAYLHDADRHLFLSAGDPDHSVPASWEANDWSLLVSAGPYDIPSGGAVDVAFAVLAGDDLGDLQLNALEALRRYPETSADVADGEPAAPVLRLYQNRPNPFGAPTTIRYSLDARGPVRLAVYDARGRLVRDLVHDVRPGGLHAVRWDGLNERGDAVATGVYFYRLDAGGRSQTRKMLLLR